MTENQENIEAAALLDPLVEIMIVGNLLVNKIDDAQYAGSIIHKTKRISNQLVDSLTKTEFKHLYSAMYKNSDNAEYYDEFIKLLNGVVREVARFNFAQYPALIEVLQDIHKQIAAEKATEKAEGPTV
jgi:hypothetical protein